MTWESIYLTCFFAGLLLTTVSFFFGGHALHVNLPGHMFHFTVGGHGGTSQHASPFNVASLMMFLTWFGAAGYIMTRYRSATGTIALTIAVAAGFIGGGLFYLFSPRVPIPHHPPPSHSIFSKTPSTR